MGKLDARQMLTVVRRLCGQDSMGPRGELDQSSDAMSVAISTPPASHSSLPGSVTIAEKGKGCARAGAEQCLRHVRAD
ncbi:hypothetical protein KH5H1_26160 [Corallococcus caeni]|nr:hypothetical protein KH5H1_26160 [Corallococcus sp. KH5-1]